MKHDLSNQQFGLLKVINYVETLNGRAMWLVQCECGSTPFKVIGASLITGNTKSCGCLSKRLASERRLSHLVDKRFGRLLVIQENVSKDNSGNSLSKVRCDCNKEFEVRNYSLTTGNTKSCGCLKSNATSELRKLSIVGQKFGKLTAVMEIEKNNKGNYLWKCQCDCGNTKVATASDLNRGEVVSCGDCSFAGGDRMKKRADKRRLIAKECIELGLCTGKNGKCRQPVRVGYKQCLECYEKSVSSKDRYLAAKNNLQERSQKRKEQGRCSKARCFNESFTQDRKYPLCFNCWLQALAKSHGLDVYSLKIDPNDLKDIWNEQKGRCAYTGCVLVPGKKLGNGASLDHKDPNGGNNKGNLQFVTYDLNTWKGRRTDEEFLKSCEAVCLFRQLGNELNEVEKFIKELPIC